MDDSLNSSNGSVCTPYDTYDYVIVAAVSSGSAMVSALCCIFVIGLIFLFKKQQFFIQRLILYHSLATLLRSFSTILRLHRLGYRSESAAINVLCILSGFTTQVTDWFLIIDYSVITFTLLMTAVFRKNVARLEGLFIFLIFIFPFSIAWIPFINNSYGRVGAWCWIRSINYDDCSEHEFGIILQAALLNVPEAIFAIIVIPTYIVIIVYVARQKCCWRGKLSQDQENQALRKHLNEEAWPLLFFPLGVVFLNIFPIANHTYRLIHTENPSYTLWLLQSIFSPLQGGYVALVYTLDWETLKRLKYRNLKAAIYKRQDLVQEYPAEPCGRSESVLSSEGEYLSNYQLLKDNDRPFTLRDKNG